MPSTEKETTEKRLNKRQQTGVAVTDFYKKKIVTETRGFESQNLVNRKNKKEREKKAIDS